MTEVNLPARATTLVGRNIRLEPLSIESLRELAPKLRVPEVFAGGHAGGPAAMPDSDEGYVEFFAAYAPWNQGGRSYVVRLADGTVVGTTSLYDFDATKASVAIGYTAYAPEVWGTAVNPDVKRTLLAALFDLGFARVIFHVDAENERSRGAVAKLGAQLDGVLRRDRQLADGAWHGTAVYSILATEWPGVRAALDARLNTFNGSKARETDGVAG
ncbi:N-acetyltransferase [Gulosibacter macacae]|uniref:N-acetyltransferase n=1 Tax=Gulosibacter macacae TaxID=2488791 RepID=A0A3P3VWD2_9MICO|nr:GNAT family protein [Gulosibacter macacae]RRJ87000.1 N-acetyltransferase [Gulosibacter macacae]